MNKKSNFSGWIFSILGAIGFIVLLALMIFLGNRLETMENRLSYTRPVAIQEHTADIDLSNAQTVYVPVYSHIYSHGGTPRLLEATLSIRNTDPNQSITISAVEYYDSKGKRVRNYLNGVLPLGPMASTEFLVDKTDTLGGAGANFIVKWQATQPVYEPVIEAVMVGIGNNYNVSFKSTGRALVKRQTTGIAPANSRNENTDKQ